MQNLTHNKYFITPFFGLLVSFLCCSFAYGQYAIIGPSSATAGQTKNYTLSGPSLIYNTWSVNNGGTIVSSSDYQITVKFNNGGNTTISASILGPGWTGYGASKIVAVSGGIPGTPPSPSIASNNCGQALLERNGSPGNGITWYWQGKTSNGTSTTKGSGTTYVPNEGNGTYYIRARNSSGQWSTGSGSRSVTIRNFSAGSVSGDQTICYGGDPITFSNVQGPSGGDGYSIQWMSSTNNGQTGWLPISGATLYTYNPPPNLTKTTWYRRRVTSCGQNLYSSGTKKIKVTVLPDLDAGSINGVAPICEGESPGQLSNTALASGGNNSYSYQWQVSNNGTSGWANVSGASSSSYTPGTLSSDKWYRRRVISCSQTKYSNKTKVVVKPLQTYYSDVDNDGLGDPLNSVQDCEQPAGYVTNASDNCTNISDPFNECTPPLNSDPQTHNYIYSRTYQKPTSSIPTSKFEDNDDYIQSITYYDGIGRPRQQVGIRQSPDSLDIVTHIGYDEYGRKIKDWLPFHEPTETRGYFRTGDLEASTRDYHKLKYADDFPNMSNIAVNAYSQKEFEASPLNRVLKQAAPGKDWKMGNGHEMEFDYDTNSTNEVRHFSVAFSGGDTEAPQLVNHGHYSAKALYKTITYDENHDGSASKLHTTEEFTDKLGRVVLKRAYGEVGSPSVVEAHDTHYVYDKYGNLTYVIPPKVTVDNVSSVELNELCYQYKYDHRNRLVEKKLPGKGWEHIVYNTLDQPVMTQDSVQRTNNQWSYTKYDAFSRVVLAGILDLNVTRTQAQTNVENAAAQYEERVGDVYTNNAYPSIFNSFGVPQIHVLNFYDDYEFPLFGYSLPTTVLGQTVTQNVKGLPTGGGVLVLDGNDDKWIRWAKAYDEKGRVIVEGNIDELTQTFKQIETKLDFVGRPEQVVTTHTKGASPPLVTTDNFEYDHMGRLTKQIQTIGAHTETLVEHTYDELGQLVQKKVGGGLQTVDYDHNVRGWLKRINDPSSMGDDLFAFGINYNTVDHGGTPLYNGNIAETKWRTANTYNGLRWYHYGYDALNRITSAMDNFAARNIALTYDKMGNIKTLDRNGHINSGATSFGPMDRLVYSYDAGNKLTKVLDNGNNTYGFVDGTNQTIEYTYDGNGNLKSDLNKGITNIDYNHLSLPMSISINGNGNNGTISYIYDATGTKLQKTVGSSVTDYAGNYVYQNGQLQFFNHPEGYVTPDGQGSYDYVYNYVDHLGNVRLSFMDNNGTTEIVEENNYYPFGLKHKGYNDGVSPLGNSVAKKWKYNGMEYDESLGLETYDFGARNYDPALGRWMNIDPLAEQMRRHSPYNYAYNNPVAFIDPDGMLSFASYGSSFGMWSLSIFGSMFTESEAAQERRARQDIYDAIDTALADSGVSDTDNSSQQDCTDCPEKINLQSKDVNTIVDGFVEWAIYIRDNNDKLIYLSDMVSLETNSGSKSIKKGAAALGYDSEAIKSSGTRSYQGTSLVLFTDKHYIKSNDVGSQVADVYVPGKSIYGSRGFDITVLGRRLYGNSGPRSILTLKVYDEKVRDKISNRIFYPPLIKTIKHPDGTEETYFRKGHPFNPKKN
ncbi:RHS repeat-associated core domain-containing protein [Flagellimonas sp. 389]|uniref:DUF6443 domain-containing protein n=1 Tax=Flagellimonas sp. 389 TaxID=2835862 RepID=UPI001BD25DA7|nr:DUF6443 domain-containing protein [Flagellimonas sp. 389]MBS9462155.1 RHS repeat-associated core domain-containing protein [Flagellimonas sp. 389]